MRPGGTEEQKYFNPRSPHGERRNPTGSGISERHFNPRSPHGERPALTAAVSSGEKFQSTLPARGATLRADGSKSGYTHFNPRSPHGERQVILIVWACASLFQSTLPARGATPELAMVRGWLMISIHAPRTGSDGFNCRDANSKKISIHAPRTGSDPQTCVRNLWRSTFQSTLPARGATVLLRLTNRLHPHFNPRSPHGERHQSCVQPLGLVRISIHAPRTGSDCLSTKCSRPDSLFQSTLPARGATPCLRPGRG